MLLGTQEIDQRTCVRGKGGSAGQREPSSHVAGLPAVMEGGQEGVEGRVQGCSAAPERSQGCFKNVY